jgi:hypothetical protein
MPPTHQAMLRAPGSDCAVLAGRDSVIAGGCRAGTG